MSPVYVQRTCTHRNTAKFEVHFQATKFFANEIPLRDTRKHSKWANHASRIGDRGACHSSEGGGGGGGQQPLKLRENVTAQIYPIATVRLVMLTKMYGF